MMITCKEASRLLSQGMDLKLPLWKRLQLRFHLGICDACANFSRQIQVLRRALRRLTD